MIRAALISLIFAPASVAAQGAVQQIPHADPRLDNNGQLIAPETTAGSDDALTPRGPFTFTATTSGDLWVADPRTGRVRFCQNTQSGYGTPFCSAWNEQ
jgi:hypothetical protein